MRAASSAATAIPTWPPGPMSAAAPRSNGGSTACRKPSSSAATAGSPTRWSDRSRRKTSNRSSSPRSRKRWPAARKPGASARRRFFPLGLPFRGGGRGGVFHQQRILQHRETEGQRGEAEQLEADPEIRALGAPDDLVDHRHHDEEGRPAEGQLAPAFLGEMEHRVEDDRQQRLAEQRNG